MDPISVYIDMHGSNFCLNWFAWIQFLPSLIWVVPISIHICMNWVSTHIDLHWSNFCLYWFAWIQFYPHWLAWIPFCPHWFAWIQFLFTLICMDPISIQLALLKVYGKWGFFLWFFKIVFFIKTQMHSLSKYSQAFKIQFVWVNIKIKKIKNTAPPTLIAMKFIHSIKSQWNNLQKCFFSAHQKVIWWRTKSLFSCNKFFLMFILL